MITGIAIVFSFIAGFWSAMALVRWTWRKTMTGVLG